MSDTETTTTEQPAPRPAGQITHRRRSLQGAPPTSSLAAAPNATIVSLAGQGKSVEQMARHLNLPETEVRASLAQQGLLDVVEPKDGLEDAIEALPGIAEVFTAEEAVAASLPVFQNIFNPAREAAVAPTTLNNGAAAYAAASTAAAAATAAEIPPRTRRARQVASPAALPTPPAVESAPSSEPIAAKLHAVIGAEPWQPFKAEARAFVSKAPKPTPEQLLALGELTYYALREGKSVEQVISEARAVIALAEALSLC